MNGQNKFRLSLTGKILIMTLVVVIISNIVLGTMSFQYSKKTLTSDVNARLKTLSDDLSNQIIAINTREFKMLHSLAAMDTFRDESISQEEKQDHLTSILKQLGGNYENLAFYDANGDAIIAAGKKMNFAKRAYFSEAFAGKDYVSDPTFSTVTNSVLQHYGVPVYSSTTNKPIGAIVLVINGNSIYDTIKDIDLGGGMHPSVISRGSGSTIANANENTDESTGTELDPASPLGIIIKDILAGKSGISDFTDPTMGMHVVCSYQPIATTQWSIFAVAPYDYYFGALKSMQIQLVIMLVATIIVAVVVSIICTKALVRPLITVKNSIMEIASGNADLTQRIPVASNDEIGDVVHGFNQFVEKLQNIVKNLLDSKNSLTTIDGDLQASTQDASASITEIIANIESVNNHILTQAGSVSETAGAVNEISSNIESLEKMIENQAHGVAQASSAVEQMIGNINSVNNAVSRMVESFGQLEEKANYGIASQTNASEQIAQIEEQSIMLQDANAAIANIAEQTNLLAMNAAIEAAHAGEAGKGFSVVADEIRKLSETSSSQSKTIGSELGKIQDTIKNVVEVSNTTNVAFSTVSKSIIETSQIIEQIRGAMIEQQTGSKQIIEALSAMNNSTSEVKVASSEMTEGNKQILSEIQKLQNATDMIKNSVEEMHIGATRINDTGAALSSISSQVSENITQIGDEIGLFKV